MTPDDYDLRMWLWIGRQCLAAAAIILGAAFLGAALYLVYLLMTEPL